MSHNLLLIIFTTLTTKTQPHLCNLRISVPFFLAEIPIFGFGGLDSITPAIFTLAFQLYAAVIIKEEKAQYPYGSLRNIIS